MKRTNRMRSLLLVVLLSYAHAIMTQRQPLLAEISAGELLDKITILRIKAARISNAHKLANIQTELATLLATYQATISASPELEELTAQLQLVNEQLWDIEDALRAQENAQLFDQEFIRLARSVYITNDKRAHLKKAINLLLESRLCEEKSYVEYLITTTD